MDFVKFLFGFSGRINRVRFLAVQATLLAVWFLLLVKAPFEQGEIPSWIATIVLIWVNLATTAKRLHDRDRRGWWAIAIFVINRVSYLYYGLFLGLHFGTDILGGLELLMVLGAVALSVLQTWIVIELFFMIGTDGANRFGPDPTRPVSKTPAAPRAESLGGVPDFLLHR
jgi:uncharacterized membrane protein YhaH (DUF805 family)